MLQTTAAWMPRYVSVAPMLDWTDRHARFFLRLISKHTWLYSEMVTTGAILHGDKQHLLGFHADEQPLALQLGGSDPQNLALCAKIGEDWGYNEINLNVGCPSDRVQSGRFGACLMAEPQLVAELVTAMQAVVDIPVTVKHRIGIDEQDSVKDLNQFVDTLAAAGCKTFIIHARKAWLQGLSPKQNRDVPPLDYERVAALKQRRPDLEIILNGGLLNWDMVNQEMPKVDGVMLGRALYHNPYLLANVDRDYYSDEHPIPTRHQIIEQFLPYVESQLQQGAQLKHMTRHILGLFQGQIGAKHWRRYLSENAYKPNAGIDVILNALPK